MIISLANKKDKDIILKKYPMACNFRQCINNENVRYIVFQFSLQSSKLGFYYPTTEGGLENEKL